MPIVCFCNSYSELHIHHRAPQDGGNVRKRTIEKIVGIIALVVVWNEWTKAGII